MSRYGQTEKKRVNYWDNIKVPGLTPGTAQPITYKLYVMSSKHGVEILKYIASRKADFRSGNIKIIAKKVTTELNESLRGQGITKLPCLVGGGAKHYGVVAIRRVLEAELKAPARRPPGGKNNDDLSSYWNKTINSGVKRDKDKLTVEQESDEEEDDFKDIERKMAEYNRNPPEHRRPPRETQPNQRNKNKKKSQRKPEPPPQESEEEPDWDDDQGPSEHPKRPLNNNVETEESVNDMMMDWWRQNMPVNGV